MSSGERPDPVGPWKDFRFGSNGKPLKGFFKQGNGWSLAGDGKWMEEVKAELGIV